MLQLTHASTLKMPATHSSELPADFRRTTRRYKRRSKTIRLMQMFKTLLECSQAEGWSHVRELLS